MSWIETTTGAVNTRYVIRLERVDDGTVLFLSDGSSVRSPQQFEVIDGALVVLEPLDDNVPF